MNGILYGDLKFAQGGARGTEWSSGYVTTPPQVARGFTRGNMALVLLTGWNMDFTSGDHPLYKQHVGLQWDNNGSWEWTGGPIPINDQGNVVFRYVVGLGSENMDNPFTCQMNYLVIGV